MSVRLTRREMIRLTGALAAGSLLAACAPAEPEAEEAPEEPVEEAAEESAEAPPEPDTVTLEHWDFGGGELEYIDTEILPAFYEKFPNIQIEHVGVPEDGYQTKLTTVISAGTQPDTLLNFNNRLYKTGLIFDLDDRLEAAGIDWKNDWYAPIVAGDCQIDDGKVYAMPTEASPSFGSFNKDLFEEAGLEPLTIDRAFDYAEWYAIGKAINKPSDNIQERIWGVDLYSPIYSLIKYGQSVPKWAGDDGHTALGNIDSPGWIEMYEYRLMVWQEELAPVGEAAEGLALHPFALGQMGHRKGYYDQILADRKEGINVGACQIPCIAPEKGATGFGAWTAPWAIFRDTEYQDQAWSWVHFLGTDGAIIYSTLKGPPPISKKLQAEMDWVADKEDGEDILTMLDLLPDRPFTPDHRVVTEPTGAFWTRITEGGEELEPALHEMAEEIQDNLDRAWEEWELMAE